MSDRIKVALIGAGGWGKQHARVLSSNPDVDFCAIVGRTENKTMERAAAYGVNGYLNIGEMLDKEQPDLVNLCLPNQGHFEATLEVIRAGVPLFVEKPLVFDLAEADTLIAEAQQKELFFGINFNHRYATAVQKAKAAIESGILGPLAFATWRFGGEGAPCPDHDNLIETQCHGFDMLEHLCGPIASVMCEMTSEPPLLHSTLTVALKFKNGAVGHLLGTYDSSYAYPGTQLIEVNGQDGRVLVEDTVKRYTYQKRGSDERTVWEAKYFNDGDRAFMRTFDTHYQAVLAALRTGQPAPVPAEAGHRALTLAHACIQSWQTGKRVEV